MRRFGSTLFLVMALAWPASAQDAGMAAQDGAVTADEAKRDAIRKNLEAQLRGIDVRVTIDARNATVQDIVGEFRRQVIGWDFILDATNIPEEYRVDEFIVRDRAWRDAFDVFLAKAQLMIDDERPGIIRFSRPARLTLNMKDADIKTVIDLIARISRANIIVSPRVSGSITLTVNDVPWNAVLDTVIKTVGDFTVVRERFDMLRVVHVDELAKQMETKVFVFRYIQPPPTYRAKIQESKQVAGRPPQSPATIEEITRQFTLLTMLKSVLTRRAAGDTLGRMDYDPAQNAIIVTDTKLVLDRIEGILKILDVEPEQVIVDVKFVSTTNDDLLSFGVNYALGTNDGVTVTTVPLGPDPAYSGAPAGTTTTGQVTRLPFGLGQEFQKTDQFFLTNYDFTATFRAFKRDSFTKLIQEPTLSVIDNNEATIFVGEAVPYAEQTTGVSNISGVPTVTISEGRNSPVKVGFTLLIVPKILRQDNKVLLTVIPQNEVLTGRSSINNPGFDRFEIGGNVIELPRVATTAVVTRLMIESGRTAVLGGLVTDRVTMEDRKIPFLGDIPLINVFFKQRNDSVSRAHLLIFVTPRIVRAARDAEQNLRNQLRELEDLERRRLEEMRARKAADEMRRQDEQRMREAAEEQKRLLEERERSE